MNNLILPILACAMLFICGCNSINPAIQRYSKVNPHRFMIVLPEGRENIDPVRAFITFKENQGYQVEIIPFPLSLPVETRCVVVQQALAKITPAEGNYAYLFIMASHEELPMGPWQLEGLKQYIFSDLPYCMGKETPLAGIIRDKDWRNLFAADNPWLVGRLPYTSQQSLTAFVDNNKLFAELADQTNRFALFGGERFMFWNDSSLIMNRAKQVTQKLGWDATLCATEQPCDVKLGNSDEKTTRGEIKVIIFYTNTCERPLISTNHNTRTQFLRVWAQSNPCAVYAISHSKGSFDYAFPQKDGRWTIYLQSPPKQFTNTMQYVTQQIPKQLKWGLSAGHYLISPFAIEQCKMQGIKPLRPAVLMMTCCLLASPLSVVRQVDTNDIPYYNTIKSLFDEGWVCGYVGTTAVVAPLPPLAGIFSEINAPMFFNSGMPLGVAITAAKSCYYKQARQSITYWLFPSARRYLAINLFTFVIYGDPSLCVNQRMN